MNIETRLIKKSARTPKFCNNCDKNITRGELYYHEEGVEEHLHSLIARNFCTNCYKKQGEKNLLGKED